MFRHNEMILYVKKIQRYENKFDWSYRVSRIPCPSVSGEALIKGHSVGDISHKEHDLMLSPGMMQAEGPD